VLRLDDVDDGLHQRGRREELAAVLRPLHGELHQEVFVDAPEHVARGAAQGLAVEDAQQVLEQARVEAVVVLGQLPLQRLEFRLDGVHGIDQGLTEVRVLRQLQQGIKLGLLRQHHGAPLDEIGLHQRTLRHPAGGLVGLDCDLGGVIAVGCVAQEDHAQHRHRVFAGSQLGVGAELVGGLPEAGLDLLDLL